MFGAGISLYLSLTLGFAGNSNSVILSQDFEGPIFPPTGWTIETSGSGPYWQASWIRDSFEGSQWAYGQATAGNGTGSSTANAKLYSPYFTLNSGDYLLISFKFESNCPMYGVLYTYYTLGLANGSTGVWSYFHPGYSQSTVMVRMATSSAPVTSSNYRLCWNLNANGGTALTQGTINAHIDNVLLTSFTQSKTGVTPASLGQLKATYH